MRPLAHAVLLACLPFVTHAETPKRYWIHAGAVLDQPGKAPRGETWIAVEGDKIAALSSSAPTDDAPVVDLSKQFLLPGLIDCHVHLASDTGGVQGQLEGISKSPAAMAYQTLLNGHKTLAAGFTTVRNLGDGGSTLALRDAVNAGNLVGPRIIDAGRSISVTAGHMDARLGFADYLQGAISDGNLCDGADECRKVVRRQIARGADVIKIATTGGVNSRIGAGLGQQMFEDEARAVVETAHLAGKKVAVHAHGNDGVELALKVGADSIEHGTMMDAKTLKMMRESGAYLVATMSTVNGYKARLAKDPNAYDKVVKPKIEWRIQITGKSFRQAVEQGANIAFGTDAGVSLHGRNADEFLLMVEHGMTPAQAIHSATVNASKLLGVDALVGTLEPGKQADFVVVNSSPLDDISVLQNVQRVYKAGVEVHSIDKPLAQLPSGVL
jgi:imidazolonepropionase-like amidohydrolase